jgi:integrin beta 3
MNTSDMDAIARAIVTPIRDFVTKLFDGNTKRIESLEQRIATLEARPALVYTGVYEQTRTYRAGETCTFRGSLWIALTNEPGTIPGPSWQLAVKKGSDGHDGRNGRDGRDGQGVA